MKLTVYLDTTIPNYFFDERASLNTFVEVTQKWWNEESKSFDMWISEETLNELAAGNYPHKSEALEFASKLKVLPPDENIVEIAQIYLDNYVMPRVLKGDAIHLAYASFYLADLELQPFGKCKQAATHTPDQHKAKSIRTRYRNTIRTF